MKETRRKWPVPEPGSRDEVLELIERYHGYGSLGNSGQLWVARDNGTVVAAWAWAPPPFGAARAVSPGCPAGALALSRMVAVPRGERAWHLSKPLRWLMRKGIDRGRWPVLVTYSDAGENHTGHVYLCSGWQKDGERWSPRFEDAQGRRQSSYANGRHGQRDDISRVGRSRITRWVHRACPKGEELHHMTLAGWSQIETGRVWASGNPARTWVRTDTLKT